MNTRKTLNTPLRLFGAALVAAMTTLLADGSLEAASIIKADTGTDLNAPSSWTGGVAPKSADIATWSGSSLGSGLTLGANTNWLGISVAGAASDIAVTGTGALTLGTGGVDATNATVNVSLGTPVVLSGAQTWGINSGMGVQVSGVLGGSGALTKSLPGSLTLSGANTNSGAVIVGAGTLTLSGNRASTAVHGALTVGVDTTVATVNVQGNISFGANAFFVGSGTAAGTNGIVNHSAGTVSFTSGAEVLVGNGASGTAGIYNFSNGTITGFSSGNRGVVLGVNDSCTGILNLSGTANLNLGVGTVQIGRSEGSTTPNNTRGVFLQTGGNAVINTLTMGSKAVGSGGSATLTLLGGTFVNNSFTRLCLGSGDTAAITIGGTADVTMPAFPAKGAASTAIITFDGGVFRSSAASANFINGLDHAYLTANGANFNIGAGKDIVIPQVLENAAAQAGVLTKAGSGVLTLTGANTFTGMTTVSNGTLLASSLTGPVTVQSGASLGVAGTLPANLSLDSNLSLNSSVLIMRITNVVNADKITVAGSLLANNVTTILLPSPTPLANGDYTLLEVSGALSATPANFSVASVAPKSYSIVCQAGSPNRVILRVSGPIASKTWMGDGLANQWNVNSGLDWAETGSTLPLVAFQNNDVVVFDDTTANFNVDVGSVVSPASVTINTINTYAFSGAGSIAGSAAITNKGMGTTILGTANTYSGGTTIAGADSATPALLVLTNSSALGTGPLYMQSSITSASATLSLGGSINVTNPIIIDASTGREAIYSLSGNNTLSGPIVINPGASALYLNNNGETGSLLAISNSITGPGSTGAFSLRGPAGNFGLISGHITLGSIFQIIGSASWTLCSSGNSWTQTRLSQGSGGFTLGANDALSTAARVTWDGDSSGALDLAGYNQIVAGLDGGALQPTVINSTAATDSLLKINGGGYTFSGAIVDGAGKIALELLSGTQTLSGNNTYTGPSTITGGTLLVNGSLATGTAVTVKSGATLGGSGTVNGSVTVESGGSLTAGSSGTGNLTVGTLTLGSGAADTQTINVTPLNTITVLGSLAANGTTTIQIPSGANAGPGTYTIISYTGPTITSGFVLGALPARFSATLQYNTSSIDLVVSSATYDSVKWTGGQNALWDTSANNWLFVGAQTATGYADGNPGDAVLFDDTLTANPAITLNTTVHPASMTFNNVTTAYNISGTGNISGSGALSKSGSNTVTLATANSFTGNFDIGNGSLMIKNSQGLGIGTKTLTIKSAFTVNGAKAELHLDGSAAPIVLPASFTINGYCDQNSTSMIVNEAGNNIVEAALNNVTGGGHLRINVLTGTLTMKGTITNARSSSNRTLTVGGSGTAVIDGMIRDNPSGSPTMGLIALGGTTIVNSTSTYTGTTTVGTGATLLVNGILGNTVVTVQSGGFFGGKGTIAGPVTVQAGATLSPGTSIGSMMINNGLTLQGTTIMEIARNGSTLTNDLVAGVGTLAYGGSLIITNVGSSPLQVGDSFNLFDAATFSGTFASVQYPSGYTFTNKLSLDGTVQVLTAPVTESPRLTFTPTGGNWVFTWPGSGFKLQTQTNTVAVGLSNNWSDVPGGSVSGVSVPAPIAGNPAVFFRLISVH